MPTFNELMNSENTRIEKNLSMYIEKASALRASELYMYINNNTCYMVLFSSSVLLLFLS
jgi:hypothetical protein